MAPLHKTLLPLLLSSSVQAGIYYDTSSCQTYKDLLNSAFLSAFEMIEQASITVGKAGNLPTYDWQFPDTEARDMAARIFGDGKTKGDRPPIGQRYTLVKNEFEYMTAKFRFTQEGQWIGPLDDVSALTQDDILVYCDLVRLRHNTGNVDNWSDPTRTEGNYQPDEYEGCKSGDTLALTKSDVGGRQIMQLCKMDQIQNKPYQKVKDLEQIWLDPESKPKPETLEDWCLQIAKLGRVVIDFYDLFDHTLLHEMSHAVVSRWTGSPRVYDLISTDDVGPGKGYGWSKVHALADQPRGTQNADSYAFYALGAWMLTRKQTKIKNNGCLVFMDKYTFGANGPTNVDNSWSGPSMELKRNAEDTSPAHLDKRVNVDVLEVRQFVTSVSSVARPVVSSAGQSASTGIGGSSVGSAASSSASSAVSSAAASDVASSLTSANPPSSATSEESSSSFSSSTIAESSSAQESSAAASDTPAVTPTSGSNATECSAGAATITNCQSTIVSGTKSFATDCSTVTTCSGSAAASEQPSGSEQPSVSASGAHSVDPSGIVYVHEEPSEDWDAQQDCVLALMEKLDIDLKALGDCFSTTLTPISETPSATPTDSDPSSAVSASETPSFQTPTDTPSATPAESSSAPSGTPVAGLCTLDADSGQCQCFPPGCSPGSDGCVEQMLDVGENGCKDDCEGCMITPSKF